MSLHNHPREEKKTTASDKSAISSTAKVEAGITGIKELEAKPNSIKTHFNNISIDLAYKMQDEKSHSPDPDILKKYQVKKFLLKTLDGHNVECWRYDEKSIQKPIYEDQGIKRGLSLIQAAKNLFEESKRSEVDIALLKKCEEQFLKNVKALYAVDVDKTFEHVNKLVKNLISDIGYIWQAGRNAETSDFQKFYAELFERVEKPPFAAYKTNNIFVMNTDPNVRSVQYYERGTDPVVAEAKGKIRTKEYFSSHYRGGDHVGLSNFIAYGHGTLSYSAREAFFTPIITDTGFRHASFAPIDMYKTKDSEAKIIDITTQNLDALFHEARSRKSSPLEAKEVMNGVYVGLLTVDQPGDEEHQDKQYRHTVLSADRLRSRGESNPIVFDFGVNGFAVGYIHSTYPEDQEFENNRAFFQLQQLILPKIQKMRKEFREDKSAVGKALYSLLTLFDNAIDKDILRTFQIQIEDVLNNLSKKYDLAKNDKEKATALENLTAKKQELYDLVNSEILEAYKESYSMEEADAILEVIKEDAKRINERNKAGQSVTGYTDRQIATYYTLLDLVKINELFLTKKWQKPSNNGVLQASILDLVNRLRDEDETLFSSVSCKSGNDRTLFVMTLLDAMRAKRVIPQFDAASHNVGHASAQSTILDTDGGGSKFGDGLFDFGHPAPKFAAALAETGSKLAGHKLAKKIQKDPPLPEGVFSFGITRADLISRVKAELKTSQLQTLQTKLPEIVDKSKLDAIQSIVKEVKDEKITGDISIMLTQLKEVLKDDEPTYVKVASEIFIVNRIVFADYVERIKESTRVDSRAILYSANEFIRQRVTGIDSWKKVLASEAKIALFDKEAESPLVDVLNRYDDGSNDLYSQFMKLDAIQNAIDASRLTHHYRNNEVARLALKIYAISEMEKIARVISLDDAYQKGLLKHREPQIRQGLGLA